jgi:hypothetical protein
MLPDEPARHAEGFTPAEVLSGIREICPTEPQGFGLARETRSDREAESLISWADEKGALWSEKNVPKTDDLTGGEHIVEIDEDSGRVFKSTKPGKFGFGVDLEIVRAKGWKSKPRITAGLVDATPFEYLERLGWQNELFGDDIMVNGVARYPNGIAVITTQPFYDGMRTEQKHIDTWFESKGGRRIKTKEGAFYSKDKDLLVMDALPRNVLTLTDGRIMPFDVVIVKPDGHLKSRLGL